MSNSKNKKKIIYIIFAILAAAFYALNIPISKYLLEGISSTILAGFLYLGAGIGMGFIFLLRRKRIEKEDLLAKKDLPYTILMVALDIAAPILLMYGLKQCSAENASLLNNFEIVITSIVAFAIFKEYISPKVWIGLVLITISSFFLSIKDVSSFTFSIGSLFILLACLCWGFENNCTRKISNKNSYQIVTIKGLCSGSIMLVIGFIMSKETISNYWYILFALLLGFVSYGLSIFLYVKAQSVLGAAKTSAFYAINPFIAAILSLIIFQNKLDWNFYVALGIMIAGSILIVLDTLQNKSDKKDNQTSDKA